MALALTACTAKAPLYYDVVRSEMERNPKASYIDGQEGKLKWNYTTGLELKSILDVYCLTGKKDKALLEYVDSWYDAIISPNGEIGGKYKLSNYSLDHICPGNTLFTLYDLTRKDKYRLAMDYVYRQLLEQPRNDEGGFWHKQIYPGQMWLDGLYMAQPFYAMYTSRYSPPFLKANNFEDIISQFDLAFSHCLDTQTGLLRHAWDSSLASNWCDPANGQSAHAWGRALGWYCMALVDVIEILDKNEDFISPTNVGRLKIQLKFILNSLKKYSDPATGMWYQVLDRPGQEGNYLEASCSAMFSYAISKAYNLHIIDDIAYARKSYEGLIKTFVSKDSKGLTDFEPCCEVAGLGGKQNRSGDYEYYIHERVRANDPKGIGPLIWAAIEYEKIK